MTIFQCAYFSSFSLCHYKFDEIDNRKPKFNFLLISLNDKIVNFIELTYLINNLPKCSKFTILKGENARMEYQNGIPPVPTELLASSMWVPIASTRFAIVAIVCCAHLANFLAMFQRSHSLTVAKIIPIHIANLLW
jgi:hypothetical protein